MKVWINEYISKVKVIEEKFQRDGLNVVKLLIIFRNGDELNIWVTKNDHKQLKEVMDK